MHEQQKVCERNQDDRIVGWCVPIIPLPGGEGRGEGDLAHGIGGDDPADALRYLVAYKRRTLHVTRLTGW